jgi:hypothetical protein
VPKKPDKPARDSTARVVDRLLRQLPGADPTLKGDPDPAAERPRPQTTQMTGMRAPLPRPRRIEPMQIWGVWGRLAGAVVLGIALTQWPYRSDCGWSLYGYLAAVTVVLLAAGWTAVAAWRLRMAPAHMLALVAGFWGIVLAAEQILPRVGYAAETQYWSCSTLRAAEAAAARARTPPVALPLPVPVPDSLAADSAAGQLQSEGRER